MLTKLAIVVLATLIGTSLAQPSGRDPVDPMPTTHLDCSSYSSSMIEILNKTIFTIDSPCHLRARTIFIVNSTFLVSDVMIEGASVNLINSTFVGDHHKYIIIGESVILTNNVFTGDELSLVVGGQNVTEVSNVYVGDQQRHNKTARIFKQIDNNYTGDSQKHEIIGKVTDRIENYHSGSDQRHTIEGIDITLIGNKYFGNNQQHNVGGMNFFQIRNEYYGCRQLHKRAAYWIQCYFNNYVGYEVSLNNWVTEEILLRNSLTEVTDDKCENLVEMIPGIRDSHAPSTQWNIINHKVSIIKPIV